MSVPVRYFVTVDAETEVLAEGVAALHAIRERVEKQTRVRIPIVWFIRFQRSWDEYMANDAPDYFAGPIKQDFDGFALGKPLWRELQQRGDELGWHYHAYNYVHRDDLTHERRVAILRADLPACAAELSKRHPEFRVQSFRFGWFFVPDYSLYPLLAGRGIRIDASMVPANAGTRVKQFNVRYPAAIAPLPQRFNGVWCVPSIPNHLVHDFNMVPHQLGWTNQDAEQASQRRSAYEALLSKIVGQCRDAGEILSTYREAFP